MSDQTCRACGNYHDRKIGGGPREREAPYGWCNALSVYSESDATRPDGVQTTKSPVSLPVIVLPGEVRASCPHRRPL